MTSDPMQPWYDDPDKAYRTALAELDGQLRAGKVTETEARLIREVYKKSRKAAKQHNRRRNSS